MSRERLDFLLDITAREASHLAATDARLFEQPMTAVRAATLAGDPLLAERVDAFAARFARLQDAIGDRLLPLALEALAEPVGPALDNLHRAERHGWLTDVEAWLALRRLRNRMVHEYIKDPAILAAALDAAHAAVPLLAAVRAAIATALVTRGLAHDPAAVSPASP